MVAAVEEAGRDVGVELVVDSGICDEVDVEITLKPLTWKPQTTLGSEAVTVDVTGAQAPSPP
jgi:hypothetical protein